MKVLIVDNEEAICLRLQRELEKKGHEVFYRTSPLVVLEELKEARRGGRPFNLLLLNVQMPEMNGLTLFSRIREERLGVETIIMSGYQDEQVVMDAIRSGANDYLKKPISLAELDASLFRVQEKVIEAANSNAMYQLLVADDEREICTRIKRELDKEGYRVTVAYNGEECLQYFKNNHMDMLITDIKMPGISGLELIEKCREITDDFVSIILTGHGDYKKARESLNLGVYGYLKKPLSLDELMTTVKKGIEQLNIRRGSVVNSNSNHKITQINTKTFWKKVLRKNRKTYNTRKNNC